MKVVIEVAKEVRDYIIEHELQGIMAEAIANGTPLPEGHGRLIDADMFLSRNAYFANKDFIDSKYEDTLKDLIDNAPTVLEADKEDD